MEGHDTFTQNTEIGDEDPFAGSDFGDWEQPGSESPAQPASPAPPAVAEPVPGPATPPQPSAPAPPLPPEESQATGAPSPDIRPGEPDLREPDPTPAESGGTTGSTTETVPVSEPPPAQEPATPDSGMEPPPEAQDGAQSAAESAAEQAGAEAARREQEGDVPIDTAGLPEPTGYDRDATRVLSDDDLAEAGYDGPVAQDGEVPVTHPAHPVNQPPQSEPSDAPPPDEPTDKRGRVTHRRYYIFTASGDDSDTYKMLSWFEDEQHQIVTRNIRGAKRQTVVLAKTPEDALKFGYVAAGSPQDGLKLVPCAVQNFQPKTVAPEPPEPMKQRLRIS